MASAGTRVYVGRLAHDCRERDLEKFFKGYGRIREVLMKNGFGFVEFDDYRDADDAVYELNGKSLLGEKVVLEIARGPRRNAGGYGNNGGGRFGFRRKGNWIDKYGPPTRTEYRLRVENLSTRVSWQDLKDYMRSAGEVTYADAHRKTKNEGVVEFATYNDMKNALNKLDDSELEGRRLKLFEEGGGSSSRRSRSYSRSRSKSPRKSRSRSPRASRSASRSRSWDGRRSPDARSRSPSNNGGSPDNRRYDDE